MKKKTFQKMLGLYFSETVFILGHRLNTPLFSHSEPKICKDSMTPHSENPQENTDVCLVTLSNEFVTQNLGPTLYTDYAFRCCFWSIWRSLW